MGTLTTTSAKRIVDERVRLFCRSVERLLHEAGVAVLADIHFGARVEGDGQHIRFSYAAGEAAITEGVRRIDTFIRKAQR